MMNQNDDSKPAPVAAAPRQAGEAHPPRDPWWWVERGVWTERMLTRLTSGESADRVWFRLWDKTYAPANLHRAFEKVWRNGGSAGADAQTVAQNALTAVRAWVSEAGLTLHPEQPRVGDARAPGGFDFLGYHCERGMKWPRAKSRAVSNRHCVGAIRGGEQRNENDQSVTQGGQEAVRRELDSVGVDGRVFERKAKPVGAGANPLAAGRSPVVAPMVGDGMAGSPSAIIRETRRGQAVFMAARSEEPPGGSQSVRSSDEAGNDRGAKGTQEGGSA